jgi:hypothetical protein
VPLRVITIVPGANPGEPAQFVLEGEETRRPVEVREGDILSWTNLTTGTHQPWPIGKDGKPLPDVQAGTKFYLSDPLGPEQSTSEGWVAVFDPASDLLGDGKSIHYCCKYHPSERGQIVKIT